MRIRFRGLRPIFRKRTGDIHQAGAIVIRDRDGGREMLLVSNKEGDGWLFPKGSVKKKEMPEEAALREVEEEAGVRGEVVAYVGATEETFKGELIRVDYFLIRPDRIVDPEEDRQLRWCTPLDAGELISDPALRELIRRAGPEIMEFERD